MTDRRLWCLATAGLAAALAACQVYDSSLLPDGPGGDGFGEGGRGGASPGGSAGASGAGAGGDGRGGAGPAAGAAGGAAAGAAGGGGEASGAGGAGGAGGAAEGCERLVINEVQHAGPTGGLDEFVELFNAGICPVVLDGYSLDYLSASTQGGATYWSPVLAGRSLGPGTFFVIASATYSGTIKDEPASPSQGIAKSGGLALRFRGANVDSITWGTVDSNHPFTETAAALSSPDGQSMARKADGVDSGDNSADFAPAAAPTPGSTNVVPTPPARRAD